VHGNDNKGKLMGQIKILFVVGIENPINVHHKYLRLGEDLIKLGYEKRL
jgi:hypothetical protein